VDALKLIPQVFFDLIARVVPGAVAAFIMFYSFPSLSWTSTLAFIAGGKLSDKNAFGFALIAALTVSYILGQLISPVGKYLEALVSRSRPIDSSVWQGYDYLRMHFPDAGALSAKIRAEYTMQFAMAASFLIGAVAGSVRCLVSPGSSVLFPIACAGLVILCTFRGLDSRKTFVNCVCNLRQASELGTPFNASAPPAA
jgi:hypothetical protein